LESPTLREDSYLAYFLDQAEWIFFGIFFVECCMKIITFGFISTPTAYLKFGVNVSYVEQLKIDTLYLDQAVWGTAAPYELEKPSYTTVDAFAEWQVTQELSLNLAVINLFDKQYREHASVGDFTDNPGYMTVGPWEAGRDVRLSLTYDF
ncbi:MAG: hypothetical protein VXZ35_14720, partial [Pseudomonadota bacterium]|nr:hypothetical protein [Pseudomonadota bacterium]